MNPHDLDYNTNLPELSRLRHHQDYQNTPGYSLQNFYLIRPKAVRIVHKTLAILVFTYFKSQIATKQLRNKSFARSVLDSGQRLTLRQAVLI